MKHNKCSHDDVFDLFVNRLRTISAPVGKLIQLNAECRRVGEDTIDCIARHMVEALTTHESTNSGNRSRPRS